MIKNSFRLTKVVIFNIDNRKDSIQRRKPDDAANNFSDLGYESVVLEVVKGENVYLVKHSATGYANIPATSSTTAYRTLQQCMLDLEVSTKITR